MLNKLVNGNRSAWEDELGTALGAIRCNVSQSTGFSPFLLTYCRPARHNIGRMLNGQVNPTWSDRLRLQSEVMQEAARNTYDSRRYNRARLQRKANAEKLVPGDQVLLRGQKLSKLTALWDHHYIITHVFCKVITLLHVPTGKTLKVNRNKVRLVDPQICWQNVRMRPRAQCIDVNLQPSKFAGAGTRENTLIFPQNNEMEEPLLTTPTTDTSVQAVQTIAHDNS